MPTINQLIRIERKAVVKRKKTPPCRLARSAVAFAPAFTPPPRKSLTRLCVRSPVCA